MTTNSKLQKAASGILIGMLLMFVAAPASAFAQGASAAGCDDPTGSQYNSTEECIENNTGSGGGGDTSDPTADPVLERNVGPLPFTGFDVIAMTAVALAVAGLGLLLQRAVARQPE